MPGLSSVQSHLTSVTRCRCWLSSRSTRHCCRVRRKVVLMSGTCRRLLSPSVLTHGDLLYRPGRPRGPGAMRPHSASSQRESLLAVIVVPIFQLLQDPIQHRRPLLLRGLCGRWQKGEGTPRGFSSESGRQRCVGWAPGESEWGAGGKVIQGREQTQLWSVQPQPRSRGPTLGSQWPTSPEACLLPAVQRPSQPRQQLG